MFARLSQWRNNFEHRYLHGNVTPRMFSCATCRQEMGMYALGELNRWGTPAIARTCLAADCLKPGEGTELFDRLAFFCVEKACETFPHADENMRADAYLSLRYHMDDLHAHGGMRTLSERGLLGFAENALFEQACAGAQAA